MLACNLWACVCLLFRGAVEAITAHALQWPLSVALALWRCESQTLSQSPSVSSGLTHTVAFIKHCVFLQESEEWSRSLTLTVTPQPSVSSCLNHQTLKTLDNHKHYCVAGHVIQSV